MTKKVVKNRDIKKQHLTDEEISKIFSLPNWSNPDNDPSVPSIFYTYGDMMEERAKYDWAVKKGYNVEDASFIKKLAWPKECESCKGSGTDFLCEFEACWYCKGTGYEEISDEEIWVDVDDEEMWEDVEYQRIVGQIHDRVRWAWRAGMEAAMENALWSVHLVATHISIENVELLNIGKTKRLVWQSDGYELSLEEGKTWKEAATLVALAFSGITDTWIETAQEMKNMYEYTSYKDAVLSNLNTVARYSEVYGGSSPISIFNKHIDEFFKYHW